MSYLFPFSYCSGVLKAKILKWFAIPISIGPLLSELSTMTHLSWVALNGMAHSFIELDKPVFHVIRLVSFLWLLFSLWLSLFILELFLHSSPVVYWAPTDLGSSSFSVLSFCLFILFMGFSSQELKWFAIPFSSGPHSVRPLHHYPSLGWPHKAWLHFIELDKTVVHVIRFLIALKSEK